MTTTDILLLLIAPAGALLIGVWALWLTSSDDDHTAKKGKA